MQTRSLTIVFLFATGTLFAQQAPQPAPLATTGTTALIPVVTSTTAVSASGTDDVVHMSPFVVTGNNDNGYQTLDTTSGSRLRTPLRDTAASISAFSEEFLSDVGATTIEEMLSYAGNVEAETEDATNGFNNENTRWAGNLDNRFRIRGIAAGVTTNYGESGIPVDLYNIGNAEIASGANSILFGLGAQGGLLTLTTKRANLQRNTLRVENTIGTWTSPAVSGIPFERAVLDYNLVLMPRAWAVRLLGVYQDGGQNSWRYWQGYHQKRLNPVMTFRPFKNTTVSLSYEKGRVTEATTRLLNSADQITAWIASGSQIAPAFPGPNTPGPPGTTQINSGGANPDFVFVNNNNTLYDFRQAYQSTTLSSYTPVRLPADMSSYYYSTVGPNGFRDQRFQSWAATIEQSAGPFNFEFTYSHNKTNAIAHSPGNTDAPLRGDPNSYISTYAWAGAGNVVPDPFSGQLYLESVWFENILNQRNDSLRLTSEVSFAPAGGKFGRHRLVALLEHTENETYRNLLNEILVDDHQVAVATPGAPNAGENQVTRRNYITDPNNFRTYHDGDWDVPITNLTIGDRVFHSTYVTANQSAAHVKRTVDTAMLALQSYWLRDTLVTTFGLRLDNAVYRREQRPARITDPNDPRILDGSKVLNEWAFNNTWQPPLTYRPWTFSAGGVWHATNRISTFANYSTNRGAPYIDGRTVLPDGNMPAMTKGRTLDYGLMFDLLGNGKWTLRLTRYDTKQFGDATITPSGIANAMDGSLGSQNLFDIFDALYFLYPTGQTGTPPGGVNGTWPAGTGPGAGPMKDASQYAIMPPSVAYPNGSPPQYNAGTVNVQSQGYELELTARPTRNIDLRFTFSYTARNRIDIFPEIFAYYNKMIPVWMKMANPAQNGNHVYMVTIPNNGVAVPGGGNTMPLLDYLRLQLYAPDGTGIPGEAAGFTSVRTGINNQLLVQSGPLGSRPYKFNFTGKYTFRDGLLRGFALGGAVVYSSPNLMPDPNSAPYRQTFEMPPEGATDLALDPNVYFGTRNMIKGNSLTTLNAFLTYRCKLFGGRTNLILQLNINNVLNTDVVTLGRIQPSGVASRVYVNPPRAFRLTTTFEF